MPKPPGNQKLMWRGPLVGETGFMMYNSHTRSWEHPFLGICYPTYEEVVAVLKRDTKKHLHRDVTKVKGPCIICNKPSMRDWISDIYCEECYSWLTVIAHNNGEDLNCPEHIRSLVDNMPLIAGKAIMIHFKATPKRNERDDVVVAADLRPRIFLGGHEGAPVLFIGKETIPLNPSTCEVHVYKARLGNNDVSKIELLITEEVRYNGQLLCGKFTKAALLGNVICNNAYYGECLTINQHMPTIPVQHTIKELKRELHEAIVEGKDQDLLQSLKHTINDLETSIAGSVFPDPKWLNEEVCVYPGVVGVIQPTGHPKNDICEWVNVGKFCSRCADHNNKVKALKESPITTGAAMKSVTQIRAPVKSANSDEYDRLVAENKSMREQIEVLVEDLKAMERTLKIVASTKSDEKVRRQPIKPPSKAYLL